MGDNYVTLNTEKPASADLEFEDDGSVGIDLGESAVEVDDTAEVILEENKETKDTPAVEEGEVKSAPKKAPKKRESRSAKRIKNLVAEKNSLQDELEALRSQTLAMKKEYKGETLSAKGAMKESLTGQMETLKQQLKGAIEAGEAGDVVEIQGALHDTQIKLAALTYELQQTDEVEEEGTPQKPTQKAPPIPEKALDWVEEHEEFKTDPIFHSAAMAVNNILISEGFKPDSDDFYEELNDRLSERFPEVFGIDDENGVDSTSEASEEDQMLTKKNKSSKSRQNPQQTVAGASRTPAASSGKSKTGRNTVKLSQADVELAKRWGITLEQFARRKQVVDKTDKGSGEYTPISIG